MNENMKRMVSFASNDSSFEFSTSSHQSIPEREPDEFIHCEIDSNSTSLLSQPVEHKKPGNIPVSSKSIVTAVWHTGEEKIMRTMTQEIFIEEFRST
jgi:hypothetical protein